MQGNKKLMDAALKKKISKFVLMSSLLTNGKEAGQSLNPGTHSTLLPELHAIVSPSFAGSVDLRCAGVSLNAEHCQDDMTMP